MLESIDYKQEFMPLTIDGYIMDIIRSLIVSLVLLLLIFLLGELLLINVNSLTKLWS